MTEQVTSRGNSRIKLACSLKKTSMCRKTGKFLLEGPRFIKDLVQRDSPADFIVISDTATSFCVSTAEEAENKGITVLEVPADLFGDISATEHSQGIVAVCPIPSFSPERVFTGGTVLALDGVGDPGNAGTAIRSAKAFGCSGILFLQGSAFPWNPKVTRASAGLNSSIPIIEAESLAAVRGSFEHYLFLEASADGKDISLIQGSSPVCIVIGSEASGVREETRRNTHGSVSIPMAPEVESLNAGVSASILLYSLFRRKP